MADKKSEEKINESEQYECQFFYEDEVYRFQEKIGKTQYGIVLENSEYASSDEDSDDEAPSESHKLKKGQIRVAWYPTGKENILSERKVSLADRSLMPGDVVVRKENGREKMCGYCRQVKTVASVRILGSDQVICNIKSDDLTPLEAFSPDIAVTLDNWVGMARSVKFKITLRTRDGSLCTMDDQQAMELRQMNVKYSRNSEFHRDEFYPGQLLVGKPSHFNSAVWIEGGPEKLAAEPGAKNKKKARIVATVEKVEVVSLGVQWQCQSWTGNESLTKSSEQPKFAIEGEDLKRVKMLNVFEPCTLQLGDKSFYSFKATDPVMSVKEWNNLQKNTLFPHLLDAVNPKKTNGKPSSYKPQSDEWESDASETFEEEQADLSETESCSSFRGSQGAGRAKTGNLAVATRSLKRRKLRKAKPKTNTEPISTFVPVAPGDQMVVETLCTYSWVDVVWQDGSTEESISSVDLFPVHHLDDKEFFPGDFVVQADSNSNTSLLDYGVVQHVDAQARTAMVQWFKTSTKPDWLRPDHLERNEVSVYDLKDHPDFKFRPGSIVVRVADPYGRSSVGSAGQVLDNHTNGQVEVWWADGATSQCWPQELYRVGDYDSDAGELWDDQGDFVGEDDDEMLTDDNGDDDSQTSWQTESEASVDVDMDGEEKTKTPSSAGRSRSAQQAQRLVTNLDKARNALHRLEPLLQNVIEPGASGALQLGEILKLLLEVYKQCRYLDRLMDSSYFHERHFEGLLEKVRDDERQEALSRLSTHLRRLFGCDASGQVEFDQGSSTLNELGRQIASFAVGTQGALARFITVAEGVCQEELCLNSTSTPNRAQSSGTDPPTTVEGSTDDRNGQDQVLQVCVRLGQLLATQLARAQEEMDRHRWPSETKETTPSTIPAVPPSVDASEEGTVALVQIPTIPVHEPITVEPEPEEPLEQSFSNDILADVGRGTFTVLENAPAYHKYYGNASQPTDPKQFQKALRQELNLLRTSLPRGIRVKAFEDRMDLFSVLIEGPAKTPYEGGLFLFDFQLPNDYPRSPPLCHYWSYCTERLNPNLYEEGKVCVSLLGTWSGKGSEMWGPGSNLMQVLVSIQGLILVAEPYYNEAGYERQRGSAQARENSRLYNEMVLLKMLQAMGRLGQNPPQLWQTEIMEFLQLESAALIHRYQRWMKFSGLPVNSEGIAASPDFPLVPASKGFCLTLNKSLQNFESIVGHALKNWHNPSPDVNGSHGDGIPNTSLNSTEEANLSR